MADRIIRLTMQADMLVSRCIACGVTYGVTADFDEDRRKDKATFYCPNGHSMSYKENEADRLRRERDNLLQQNARLEEERIVAERKAAAERQKRERVEKRVGAGVCPCCSRTVSQLAKHMQTKHPDVPFVTVAKPDPRKRVRA